MTNSLDNLKRFLDACGQEQPRAAVLEAGPNWTVMYDWLESLVDDVKLAHPLKVKAIAEAKIKTDKIDSHILAQLLRADLIPSAYVCSAKARELRDALRHRLHYVAMATKVKNKIHAVIDKYPDERAVHAITDIFCKQGRQWLALAGLSKTHRQIMDKYLQTLSHLEDKIKESDALISMLTKKDSRVERLMSVPGIGKFFASLIVAEIDDISRFKSPDKLAAYAGIIPSTHSSGNKSYHGRMTKQGNKYLRWALIESVWPAIRKDLELRAFYEQKKVAKGTNKAKVAVARRLAVIVYRVLTQDRDYFPGRLQLSTNGGS